MKNRDRHSRGITGLGVFGILFLMTVLASGVPLTPLSAQPWHGPDSPLKIGVNYRIHPGNFNQTEVFIVKSPLTEKTLFVSCNTLTFIPFFISEGVYTTTDGGATWQGSDTCNGEPVGFHGGDPGIAIDKEGTFIMTRMGRAPFVGLFSHYSTDNGVTWSTQKAISTDDLERATLISDTDPSSAYFGRTYAAWVKFALPYPLMFSYTADGSRSWSAPKAINDPVNRSAGGDVELGLNGTLYVCWAAVTDVSPFREIYVGFASSTTGGESWNVTENAFAMNGITGELPGKDKIRVNGLPSMAVDLTEGPRKGWIYVVTGQKELAPAGSDPDIILNRSTDGGVTWSAGIRVNQDPLNNGKTQYFPAIHVDRFGGLDILYYDDRFTTNDSCGVMLARSTDGGDTWTEYRVNDRNFKPTPIGGLGQGYQGDNIDLTSTDEGLWPVWMDNRTGIYQVWTVPVKYSDINAVDEPHGSENGSHRLFVTPNPFTSHTRITYRLDHPGEVSLNIFDLSGRLISELIHDFQQSGTYTIDLNSSGCHPTNIVKSGRYDSGVSQTWKLKPGIYLCRIETDDRTETVKLIVR